MKTHNIPSNYEDFIVCGHEMRKKYRGEMVTDFEQYFFSLIKGCSSNKSGKVCNIYIGNKQYSLKKAIAITEERFAEIQEIRTVYCNTKIANQRD